MGQALDGGGIPKVLGFARDNPEELREISGRGRTPIRSAPAGVSAEKYDPIKEVLAQEVV